MQTKQVEVTARDGSNLKKTAHLIVCDCGGDRFCLYRIEQADCGCDAQAWHLQCLACGASYCNGTKTT